MPRTCLGSAPSEVRGQQDRLGYGEERGRAQHSPHGQQLVHPVCPLHHPQVRMLTAFTKPSHTTPLLGWVQSPSSGLPGHLLHSIIMSPRQWTEHPKGRAQVPSVSAPLCPALCQAHSVHHVFRVKDKRDNWAHAHGCPALICPVLARWTPTVASCATRCAMSWHGAHWSQCSGQMWSSWVLGTACSPGATRPPNPVL